VQYNHDRLVIVKRRQKKYSLQLATERRQRRCIVSLLKPHSIILASCTPGCKPGFRPGLQPGFRQVRAGLRHAYDMLSTRFRLILSKTWSQTCCINQDVRSSLGFKQVCSWLSTCFRPACNVLSTRSRKSKARFAACGPKFAIMLVCAFVTYVLGAHCLSITLLFGPLSRTLSYRESAET